MDNINRKRQPDSSTHNKNTSFKHRKGKDCKDQSHTNHSHCIVELLSKSDLIDGKQTNACSDQKSKDHHPESKQPVTKNTIHDSKHKHHSKNHHG